MVDNLFYSTEGNFENFFDLLLKGFLSFLNFFFQAEREGEKGRLLGKLGMKKRRVLEGASIEVARGKFDKYLVNSQVKSRPRFI